MVESWVIISNQECSDSLISNLVTVTVRISTVKHSFDKNNQDISVMYFQNDGK